MLKLKNIYKMLSRDKRDNSNNECQIILTDNIFNNNLIEKNDKYNCLFKHVTKEYVLSLLRDNEWITTIDDCSVRCKLSRDLNICIPTNLGIYIPSNKSDIIIPYDKIIIVYNIVENSHIDYWMYGIKNKL